MAKYVIMIVTCFIVGGAMAYILTWFLRRLKNIEEARWGKPAEHPAMTAKSEKKEETKKQNTAK